MTTETTHKVEIHKRDRGDQPFYWRIVHRNGRVLAHSESYHNRDDAETAALNFIEACKADQVAVIDVPDRIRQES